MEKHSIPHLSPVIVGRKVLDHLANQDNRFSTFHVEQSPLVLQKSWSTIYYINLVKRENRLKLVAKIPHFPDQQSPEVSWQSEELIIRSQNEFNAISRIYEYFSRCGDESHTAIRPYALIPEINAVVMEKVEGRTLHEECFTVSKSISWDTQKQSDDLFYSTGEWLRKYHQIENTPPFEDFDSSLYDPVNNLLLNVGRLRAVYGVMPAGPSTWDRIIGILKGVSDNQRVWIHGDLHLRNILILPDNKILGFDTAMSRFDSPLWHLGKFVANLKTRRNTILSLGLLPSPKKIRNYNLAFLNGYFSGKEIPILPLALYEGQFLFEKWLEYLDSVKKSYKGGALIRKRAGYRMVNLIFGRITKKWMYTIINAL